MFCANCGTQIPDNINYCSKCGASQESHHQVNGPKNETCEIKWDQTYDGGFLGPKVGGYFYADAIGPKGVFPAGYSEVFICGGVAPDNDNKKVVEAMRALINFLVEDGWESSGDRGNSWWNQRFHRMFDPMRKQKEHCCIHKIYRSNTIFDTKNVFQAIAIGFRQNRKTPQVFAESLSFNSNEINIKNKDKTKPEVLEKFDRLIEQLKREGWQPIPEKGEWWYQLHFQREC